MYKYRRHVIPMTEDDEVIVDLGFASPGLLTDASVNYRARIGGEWFEVVRYDNAHRLPHRHRFWLAEPASPLSPRVTPSELVNIAKADLLQNWTAYRRRMEAKPR